MNCPHCNKTIDFEVTISKQKRAKNFVKPTLEEVKAYAAEIGFPIDADYFINYYEARNWMLNKVKMKNWKACIQTWFRNYKERNPDFVPDTNISENEAEGLLGGLYGKTK